MQPRTHLRRLKRRRFRVIALTSASDYEVYSVPAVFPQPCIFSSHVDNRTCPANAAPFLHDREFSSYQFTAFALVHLFVPARLVGCRVRRERSRERAGRAPTLDHERRVQRHAGRSRRGNLHGRVRRVPSGGNVFGRDVQGNLDRAAAVRSLRHHQGENAEDDPGSLSPEQTAQLVSYILRINKVPSGKTDLPAEIDPLKDIRIDIPGARGKGHVQ